ncbi:MAG: phosphomannomutase/phosphoglucomutase [Oceanicoccus sp.]|jgi:phosphomannomutase/phosphoglucomutase
MAKDKAVKATTKKTKNNESSSKLQSVIATGTIFTLLVTVVSFGYLGLIERPLLDRSSVQLQAQTMADSQASLINHTLRQLRLRLSAFANAAELLTALENKDELTIQRHQTELDRAFPESISAKLMILGPLGIASFDKKLHQLRNNIELDILRAVSSGNDVQPEAYKVGDKWLFSLAESIKSPEKKFATGALLLTLDGEYIKSLLAQLDSNIGSSNLVQKFKNKENIIATTGPLASTTLKVSADISSSSWTVNFVPSAVLISRSSLNSTVFWALFGAVFLTLIADAFFIKRALQKTLNENLDILTTFKSKPSSFTLPGFGDANKKIKEKLKNSINSDSQEPNGQKQTAQTKEPVSTTDEIVTGSEDTNRESLLDISETIFRAYDIRGLAEQQLTDPVVYAIGLAIGSEALDQGQQHVVVASDGRHSSPRILEALTKGLLASGRDVIDIGMSPTPLMYFATHEFATHTGVMVTGSHNPAEYNGIKIVIGGRALSGEAIENLRHRIMNKNLVSGQGSYQTKEIEQSYIDYIINDVAIAQPLKIVIDAGNGVTGEIAPRLFEELGCDVVPLFCDIDGNFPNHHPDPTIESNLEELKRKVIEEQADLGIAFDGDGDRLGVVTASGKFVAADRLLMLLAQDVVSRNPGADVIFDVKCTRNLNTLISNYGGRPIMWKTGHSFMKEKMVETGALLGGEFAGHFFSKNAGLALTTGCMLLHG